MMTWLRLFRLHLRYIVTNPDNEELLIHHMKRSLSRRAQDPDLQRICDNYPARLAAAKAAIGPQQAPRLRVVSGHFHADDCAQ